MKKSLLILFFSYLYFLTLAVFKIYEIYNGALYLILAVYLLLPFVSYFLITLFERYRNGLKDLFIFSGLLIGFQLFEFLTSYFIEEARDYGGNPDTSSLFVLIIFSICKMMALAAFIPLNLLIYFIFFRKKSPN